MRVDESPIHTGKGQGGPSVSQPWKRGENGQGKNTNAPLRTASKGKANKAKTSNLQLNK